MRRPSITTCVSAVLSATIPLAGIFAVGCDAPRVREPVTAKFGGTSPDDQLEFWHALNDRPITSNDDAMHGLLLYFAAQDTGQDYAGRVRKLKDLGLVQAGFDRPANEAVERGDVAYAIVKGLHVRGGWVMLLAGPTPRYAVRELEYKGLFPPSSPQQPLSGAEFVGIIGKVEDYQRGNPTNLPATELPKDSTADAAGVKR